MRSRAPKHAAHSQVPYKVTRVLADAANMAEAAPRLLAVIAEGLEWDLAFFWTPQPERGEWLCAEAWHAREKTAAKLAAELQGQVVPEGAGLPRRMWVTVEAAWWPDLKADRQFGCGLLREGGMRSAFAFPLKLGKEVLGVMQFLSHERRGPDPEAQRMCAALASQAAQFAECKRAQEALEREHAFTTAVLDTCGALVLVLDTRGCVVRFNRAAERTIGYTLAEVRDRPIWEFLVPPQNAAVLRTAFEEISRGQKPLQNENRILARDGKRHLITWTSTVLQGDDRSETYIIATGIDITERKRLEREILDVSEREQRRIGQDLHDGLCQHLAATELMGRVLEQKLEKRGAPEACQAEAISSHVRDAIAQTRLLARGLSPVTMEADGLMGALQALAANTEQMFKVRCRFQCPSPVAVRSHAAATHLFRIAQEAVSNALKHAQPRQIVIELGVCGGRRELTIADDGRGMPKPPPEGGMGLRIMQYRAGIIGAALEFAHGSGQGTRVVCAFDKQL